MKDEAISDLPPLGPPVPNWRPPTKPEKRSADGRWARLSPLEPVHATPLFAAFSEDANGLIWRYLPYGPFKTPIELEAWITRVSALDDPMFFAIAPLSGPWAGAPCGFASFLRSAPEAGSIEIGHICLAPTLQRTPAATEALVMMARDAFDRGYRRLEWKCNALNESSRRAAQRLGFSFEGVHRQAAIVKGRNRDTAWYSILDSEWPRVRDLTARWLEPENFDSAGRQRRALSTMTAPHLAQKG